MKIFSTTIKVKKFAKTNGFPWCRYEDGFGLLRTAIVKGTYGELMNEREYNVVVAIDDDSEKYTTYIIPQSEKTKGESD